MEIPIGTRLLNYIIGPKIGQGAFGMIYSAVDDTTGLLWAIKTESSKAKKKTLAFEYQILSQVQDSPYFPRLGILGDTNDFGFISMELLGPSVSTIIKGIEGNRLSFSTAVRACYHILNAIRAFHSFGLVHRDIKPANVLVREGTDNPICLLDFGLARMYIDPKTGQHIPQRDHIGFRGTKHYASRYAHMSMDLSRRDDLISWFYLSFELIVKELPWRGLSDNAQILAAKDNFDVGKECSAISPELFEAWRYISALTFEEDPDYDYIKKCLQRTCRRGGFQLTDPFDWSPYLHEHRRKVAQALEAIDAARNDNHVQLDAQESALNQSLLGQKQQPLLVLSPFSHLSEEKECCGGCFS